MRRGMRFGLSAIEKRDVWSRWRAGQSLHEIGRAFDKPHSCIRAVLLPRGGIPPALRRRSPLALTVAEREDISRGIASGSWIREIARGLDRAASSVCREVARHGGRPAYRAQDADQQAWVSALRPKSCLLAENRKLRDIVASRLILDWSPEQISGWLKNQYPNDESLRVSHETIYRSLFIQARGALKKELLDHLRSKRRMRRSRHSSEHGQSRGQIVDAISIRQRPAEVEERAIPGHWEGDLLAGGKNSYIATLVERHSRFVMLIKMPSKETEAVVAALSQHVRKLPASLKRSLTWDRGLEMAKAINIQGLNRRRLRAARVPAEAHQRLEKAVTVEQQRRTDSDSNDCITTSAPWTRVDCGLSMSIGSGESE
jgi:IS30 family transposase